MKISLGSGSKDFGPDWIHIDGGEFPHVFYHDVTNLSQYRNNEVDLIYASHLIAYFSREEIIPILNEWKRVLRPGGILRLATPDFEEMIIAYLSNKVSLSGILGPLYGKMSMSKKTIYHKTCYDYGELRTLLLEVGFKNPITWSINDTEHSDIDDHSKAHLPHDAEAIRTGVFTKNHHLISLNIEVTK